MNYSLIVHGSGDGTLSQVSFSTLGARNWLPSDRNICSGL